MTVKIDVSGTGRRRPIPRYREVAAEIRAKVVAFEFGDRLPTTEALAALYGVSKVTMQRAVGVLRDEGVVTTAPRRGIRPTRLKRRRTNTLGALLFAAYGGLLHEQLARGLERAAAVAGLHLIRKGHDGDLSRAIEMATSLMDGLTVDGFIVWPPAKEGYQALIDGLRERDFPLVLVPEPLVADAGINTIYADHAAASSVAMRHLIDSGRKRIGFAGFEGIDGFPAIRERLHQYLAALMAAELPACSPLMFTLGSEAGQFGVPSHAETWLRDVVAVFCATDAVAARVVAVCARYRVSVPHDVAVLGYDNTRIAKALDLTSVDQRFDRVGAAAVNTLIDEIEGVATAPVHRKVPSELVVRGSTAG